MRLSDSAKEKKKEERLLLVLAMEVVKHMG